MVVFFDNSNELNKAMLDTMRYEKSDAYGIVLADEPFLPEGISSIFEYYLGKYEKQELKPRDLYYVFVEIPEYWAIRADGVNGMILDMEKRMATIYFTNPLERRIVERIEWNDASGCVYKIDYYCKYGHPYCSAYVNPDGTIDSKVYYTSEKEEIIHVNMTNQVVTLLEKGRIVSMHHSLDAFKEAVMEEIFAANNKVILTSCKQAEWVMKYDIGKKQIGIAMQESVEIKKCQQEQYTKKLQSPLVVFCNHDTKDCVVNTDENEYRVCYSGLAHPDDKDGKQAFILTYSDEIFGIEALVERVPEVTFHIAAKTLVSQKLSDMERYKNVQVHPGITLEKLQSLLNECSFYLDINSGGEVDNIIVKAIRNGMLVLGYQDMLHNHFYVQDECIFDKCEEEKFARMLQRVAQSEEERVALHEKQQERIKEMNDIFDGVK